MKNNLVLVSISEEEYLDVLRVLIRNDIYYENLEIKNDKILLKLDLSDYDILASIFKNVKIMKRFGFIGFISFLKKHYIFLFSMLVGYLVTILLSNIIFSIDIITSNNTLKEKIVLDLKENNIVKYKFMKSFDDIEKIKKKLLEENKDNLEWIEIERQGTKYIINLTERVKNNRNKDIYLSNIVAKKEALLKYVFVSQGTKVRETNELVKKGDIIITGHIIKDEEIVDTVNAEGRVYGEVWYTINTTVPYKHTIYEKTKDVVNHIYLDIFGKKITLIGKYETNKSMNEEKTLIEKPYLFFKVVKETKELYDYKEVNLTKKEAYEEAINRSDKALLDKLGMDEYIIDKKVLKKEELSSKINIEVFYRVYENITEEVEIPVVLEGE